MAFSDCFQSCCGYPAILLQFGEVIVEYIPYSRKFSPGEIFAFFAQARRGRKIIRRIMKNLSRWNFYTYKFLHVAVKQNYRTNSAS